jgi:hypothetical protein
MMHKTVWQRFVGWVHRVFNIPYRMTVWERASDLDYWVKMKMYPDGRIKVIDCGIKTYGERDK